MLDLQARLLALNAKAYDIFANQIKHSGNVVSICTNLFEDEFGITVEAWFAEFDSMGCVNSELDNVIFYGASLEEVIIKLEKFVESKSQ